MRPVSLISACLFIVTVAHAGTTVSLPSSDGKASGYLWLASDKGKHPAIIVIQESRIDALFARTLRCS